MGAGQHHALIHVCHSLSRSYRVSFYTGGVGLGGFPLQTCYVCVGGFEFLLDLAGNPIHVYLCLQGLGGGKFLFFLVVNMVRQFYIMKW